MGEKIPEGGNRSIVMIGAGALATMLVLAGLAVWLLAGGGPAGGATPVARLAPATAPAVSTYPGDIAALAKSCATIPSGNVPAYLTVQNATSATTNDPVTGQPAPAITVRLAGPVPANAGPFSVTVILLAYSASAPAGDSPIDSAGAAQLFALWDGHAWHHGIRNWNGSSWTAQNDADAAGFDLTAGNPITFYWNGLSSGSSYGEIVATADGCADYDLNNQLAPQKQFNG